MDAKTSGDKPPQRGDTGDRAVNVLGPVPSLEEHVRPDWWRGIFNWVYLKTDGDVVDDQNITREEVDLFLQILKCSPDDRILDLCCGQGRHSLELARRGFKNIEGLDRSHYLVQRARRTAQQQSLNARFKEGDARKVPYPSESFDVVMILGNSFGYFETVQDDLRVLKEAVRVLKPWGRLLIDATDGEYLRTHFAPRSWEWIDKRHFVCRERSLSIDGQRLISREVVTQAEKGVIADQFYAERLYSREDLVKLMKAAGFSEPAFHGAISPNSQRNQDLGMMESRIILTGQVRKEWSAPKVKRGEAVKEVAVVMGDPTKSDPLKPSSVFDDDDFYTIDQLKAALRELDGYRFTYLTDHDELIPQLTRLRGKVAYVFNLCDEGFVNDPRRELHVPSLLEILGLPYTGGGPQCLAHCYDKSLVRGIAKEMAVPVPAAFFIRPGDSTFELPVSFPIIVKPNFGDSSFGITQRSVCNSADDLVNAISEIREKFGYQKPILLEEFLTGDDLSVGILGNPPSAYNVLPITVEDYSAVPAGMPRLCGYEAKWDPTSPYWNIKSVAADLPDETERTIVECCLKLFERLECRDYARFDWRLDAAGHPKLLEVNPNPGWCWDGHLAKMAKWGGLSYSAMLGAILKAAEVRLGLYTNGNGNGNGHTNGDAKAASEQLVKSDA